MQLRAGRTVASPSVVEPGRIMWQGHVLGPILRPVPVRPAEPHRQRLPIRVERGDDQPALVRLMLRERVVNFAKTGSTYGPVFQAATCEPVVQLQRYLDLVPLHRRLQFLPA